MGGKIQQVNKESFRSGLQVKINTIALLQTLSILLCQHLSSCFSNPYSGPWSLGEERIQFPTILSHNLFAPQKDA